MNKLGLKKVTFGEDMTQFHSIRILGNSAPHCIPVVPQISILQWNLTSSILGCLDSQKWRFYMLVPPPPQVSPMHHPPPYSYIKLGKWSVKGWCAYLNYSYYTNHTTAILEWAVCRMSWETAASWPALHETAPHCCCLCSTLADQQPVSGNTMATS